MTATPAFPELLSLIDDRSAALRRAVAGTDRGARVPGCPDWSLHDLVAHLGGVHRFWAAVVAAGPSEKWPDEEAIGDVTPHGDLLAWSADSTAELLAALSAAGPDRGCWAWWSASGAPLTAGAVARHQVQEAAVHAFDAQQTSGRPEPLPTAVALDGVAEFLQVLIGSSGPWPHRPARLSLHSAEGPSWPLDLPEPSEPPSGPVTQVHGPASDLVLVLYGRRPADALRVDGDRALFEQLLAWLELD
ncbi:MAG: hypothetical protein QOI83_4642 [Streptomycetaceae bacterium]|nr:hypothetical protein [Streptomycetaceae bacterium]